MFGFGKQNKTIQPLDLFINVTSFYWAFYEQHGYNEKADPESALIFITDIVKEKGMTINEMQARVLVDFFSMVYLHAGEFPDLLRRFKSCNPETDSTKWQHAMEALLSEMESKGFNL
jgi:hypothetical protein